MSNHCSVLKIREKIISKVDRNVDLFDEIDVKRLLTDDYQIERFIIEYETEDTAFDTLVKALLWKKEYGVYDRTEDYFFREYLELSNGDWFGRDREGRYVCWVTERAKHLPYIRECLDLAKQHLIFQSERSDQMAHRYGVTHVLNAAGMEKSDLVKVLNFDSAKFALAMRTYYPLHVGLTLIIDLPIVLRAVAKLMLSFSGKKTRDKIQFITPDQLTDFVGFDIIPTFLGGLRLTQYKVSINARPYHELDRFNFSDKSMQKFFKSYNKVMNNSENVSEEE